MKRIEFIAPVEAMRGNLSGRQKLEYPTDNKGAYEGPVGSVNYARNYSARFIGAKIAKSGKKYFAVRTKTANHLTAKAKKAMALLGGTGAIVGAIFKNKTSQLYSELYAQWIELQNLGSTKTFRQSLSDAVRAGLIAKVDSIPYAGPRGVVYIDNPWCNDEETINISISPAVLVKFWEQLAVNPVTFTVDGMVGVGRTTDNFELLVPKHYNILNLVLTNTYVTMNGDYLLIGDDYATDDTNLVNGMELISTSVAPV